ncbi:MAG: bifunctional metallophosphatase/5'-nucleotidase [Thermoanaerobaculales bacterium]|jgi:2',3'-cyclic-nucleotide 2'-phosphodiesterase/3'-nucleotidase|nr:bifunctional metallophosphatase/5'-nucleotidase [Thermoanaerobaculales bacterium]
MADRRTRTPATIVGCAAAILILSFPADAQVQRLTLLHTSDLHGSVLPWDDLRDRPADGSLAQVATLVGAIRAESTSPVLVLDSGDTIQGTPLEQFSLVRWADPSPTISVMNRIGYDAMAVGNHEFNFGLETLRRAESQADFPFLSANTVDAATGEPVFPERMVIEAGEVRVGVVGLTTPAVPGWERPEHIRGLAFRPMDEVAREQVERLRSEEGCDLVVVLAHTGFEGEPGEGPKAMAADEDWAERLARLPGIDVLLTGHTHRDIPPYELDGAIVSQPRARARLVTRIDLELERGEAGWRISSWSGRNLETAGVEPDPTVVADLADLHRRVKATLDGPVGDAAEPVSVAGCRLRDCAAVDLIHEVQLEASGAELSLASLLTDRTPDLEAGPVTWRWVHGLYVYPNTLVKLRVTGAEIVDVLEHAARYYDGLECDPSGACAVVADPDIPIYNVDSVAGLSYRIDPTRPEGARVVEPRYRGRTLEPDRELTLVCNNFRAAGGGGFPHLAEAERLWQSPAEVADLIGDFIARRSPWRPAVDGNWWLGPVVTDERTVPASP